MQLKSLIAVFASVVSIQSALAGQVQDPAGRAQITVPDDWTAVQGVQAPTTFLVRKVDAQSKVSACGGAIIDNPKTRSMSQADIDKAAGAELNEQGYRNAFQTLGFKDVEVHKLSTRAGDGHTVYVGVLSWTMTVNGTTVRLKGRDETRILPGVTHDIVCMTAPDNYAAVEPEFEAIQGSYKFLAGLVASNSRVVSPTVTLHAAANFQGTQKGVIGDTPNVMQVGWDGRTGSLSAADTSSWQVCEGVGYTGRCMTLTNVYAGIPNQVFRVNSLRRLPAHLGAQVSPVQSAAGRGVIAAMPVLTAKR